MAQYDGSIRILTEISTETAKKSLGTLSNTIVKTAKEISSLRSKMDALKGQKFKTDEYKKLQADLSGAEAKLSELVAKQTEWEKLGITSGGAWDTLNEEIAKASDNVDAIKEKMNQLEEAGKAFTLGEDTQEYENLERQLQYEEEALRKAQRLQEIAKRTGDPYGRLSHSLSDLNGALSRILHPIESVKSSFAYMAEYMKAKAAGMAASIINGIVHPFQTMKNIASGAISKTTKLLSGMASVAKKASSSIKSIASHFFSIGKSSKSASGGISSMSMRFKNLLKYGLGIRSLYSLISKLRSAIKEGFSNLYNDPNMESFKNTVDSLKASLLTLKNAFAAAFKPLVEIAIPYIQKAIEYMTRLADAFGQLIAALTGQKKYTKAIKQTAEALKEEKKAAEGYLSPLDEINKYQTSKADDTGAESGQTMFEEVPISDKFKDIAQWLKDMWENADFTELGALLGQKLKDALDNIPWDGIKETARKIGSSIATLINGFIEVAGLGISIGKTLAEAINTGFEFFNEFVHKLHWESIGKFIADTISKFFQNIDWDLIYDTFVTGAKGLGDAINSFVDNLDWDAISTSVSNFINTFVDTIYTFVTTVDWKKLGQKVGKTISDAWKKIDWKKAGKTLGEVFKAFFDFVGQAIEAVDWWAVGESVKDFLVGIDWAGVAESFFEAVGAAIGGLAAFLGGLIADGVEAAKEYFQDKIEEAGGDVVLGIFKGIADAIVGIGQWIYEHILTPFLEGFKKAFGIHSPSTVMAEMGKYLIEGLLNGIKSLVGNVEELWNSMKQFAVDTWNSVKDWMSDTWSSIKQTASQKWTDIKQNVSEKWNQMKSDAKSKFSEIGSNIAEAWNKAKENTQSAWQNIKEKTSSYAFSIVSNIRDKFTSASELFRIFSQNAQSIWGAAWESMSSKLGSVLSGIKDAISSVFGWISDMIGSIMEKLSGVSSGVSAIRSSSSSSILRKSTSSISKIKIPNIKIPKLATGSVIPANKEFLAVLGDQKHGTNVEAPLDTIKQATEESILNVLSKLGMSSGNSNGTPVNLTLQVSLDGAVIGQKMVDWGKLQQMATGSNPYGLGTT